jgi:short-subunit dehydrogenase
MTKSAIVTGASRGLGLHLSRQLLSRRYRVAMLSRDEDRLQREAAALRSLGGEVVALPADVTDAQQVREAVGRVEQAWGPIDVAIANAGIRRVTRVAGFALADAEQLMRTNYFGMLHLFDAVVPRMMDERRGVFAGVASLAGKRCLPGGAAYAASKAAMQSFLDTVRVELKPHGVEVITVNPWFIWNADVDDEVPRPRMVEPDWAARVIVRGIESGKTEIEFPMLPALLWKVVRILPNAWFARLFAPRFR